MSGKAKATPASAGAPVIQDARFQALHKDPRFARRPTKDKEVDERFLAASEDPRFQDGRVDKRKRPRGDANDGTTDDARSKKKARKDSEDAPAPAQKEAKPSAKKDVRFAMASKFESEEDSAAEEAPKPSRRKRETAEHRLARLNRMARGQLSDSDELSDSSSSSDEADTDEEAERAEKELNEGVEIVIDPEAPDLNKIDYTPDGSETKRLAAVSMDWDNIRAVDILAALQSFAPSGGNVTRVTIYPSDYGLKKMAEEARFGPTPLLGNKKSAAAQKASDDDDEDDDADNGDANGNGEFDPLKLRAYELNKMKYYYAVIECSDVPTAIQIYTQCDGMEYEATSNVFDLRFVPDDTEFTNQQKDVADSVPEDYEPPEFATAALQSSNVELTWDAEDPRRKRDLSWDKLAKKAVANDDEDENADDIQAYLASSSSDDDEEDDEEEEEAEETHDNGSVDGGAISMSSKMSKADRRAAERERLRALLLGDGPAADSKRDKKSSKRAKDDDDDDALEITFTPGLGKEILKNKKKRETEAAETTWEAYQRKKKEKRKEKKAEKAAKSAVNHVTDTAADAELSDDDFFIGGTAGKKQKASDDNTKAAASSATSGKLSKAEQQRRKAELELLTMDADDSENEGAGRNYDLKTMIKQQKLADKAAKKNKNKKSGVSEEVVAESAFKVDVADPRFAPALSNPDFDIDPTAPSFKHTAGMKQLLESKRVDSAKAKSGRKLRPMVVTAGAREAAVNGNATGSTNGSANGSSTGDVSALANVVKAKFKMAASEAARHTTSAAALPKAEEITAKAGASKAKAPKSSQKAATASKASMETKRDGPVQVSGASNLAALLGKK